MQALLQSGRREPMGIKKLSAMVGISPATIQSVHEPFLMRLGLMTATPRGRIATQRAAFLPRLRNEADMSTFPSRLIPVRLPETS